MRAGRGRIVAGLVAATAVLAVPGSWGSVQPEPTLSRAQVRQVALDWNAQQERMSGRTFAPMRVTGISLGTEGSGAARRTVWRVAFAGGTYVGCGGWWCNLYSGGGSITVNDRPGSCSGNVELCEQQSRILLNRVTGSRSAGTIDLGPIPLFQAMHVQVRSARERSAAEARKIALRYLRDNESALRASTPLLTAPRIVSLRRLQPGQVRIVDRRQGGFKAGPPTWIARVEGTLANWHRRLP